MGGIAPSVKEWVMSTTAQLLALGEALEAHGFGYETSEEDLGILKIKSSRDMDYTVMLCRSDQGQGVTHLILTIDSNPECPDYFLCQWEGLPLDARISPESVAQIINTWETLAISQ